MYIYYIYYILYMYVCICIYIYIYMYICIIKKSTEENRENRIHLDGKLQNLISTKSGPPFQKHPFVVVLQSRCS